MSIFANFSGGKSRKDILRASAEAEARLAQGRTAALGELAGGETGAKGFINRGYDDGRAALTRGYDTARTDLTSGYDQARSDITSNFGAAENAVTDAMGRVRSVYQPLQQAGNWAQDLYNRALGMGGAGGVSDALATGLDPYRQYRDEMLNKELQAQFNARGLGGSGRFASALSRASLERGSQDLQQYLTRLENQATRGQNVASQLAGYEANAGNTIAGIRQGTGTSLAGVAQNRGTSLANLEQNRGNVMGQQDINRGNALADITDRYAQTRAGVESGTAQQLAANRINVGNGLAQTRSTGMNNLISLGGLALSAASGMPTGFGGRSTTSPGTAANGGWSTTTQRAGNPLFQFGNLFG